MHFLQRLRQWIFFDGQIALDFSSSLPLLNRVSVAATQTQFPKKVKDWRRERERERITIAVEGRRVLRIKWDSITTTRRREEEHTGTRKNVKLGQEWRSKIPFFSVSLKFLEEKSSLMKNGFFRKTTRTISFAIEETSFRADILSFFLFGGRQILCSNPGLSDVLMQRRKHVLSLQISWLRKVCFDLTESALKKMNTTFLTV